MRTTFSNDLFVCDVILNSDPLQRELILPIVWLGLGNVELHELDEVAVIQECSSHTEL